MKRYIRSAEMPPGFLKTNHFNSRINGNNNVLEAIEFAIAAKFDQFDKMLDRQMYLTSGTSWTGKVTEYPEGYYVQLEATRSSFQAFVSAAGEVTRKPTRLSDPVGEYDVSGDAGHIQYISPMHQVRVKLKPWSTAEQKRAEEISSRVYDYLINPDFYDTEYKEVYNADVGEGYGLPSSAEATIDRAWIVYATDRTEDGKRIKKGKAVPGTVHYIVGIYGEILDENLVGYMTYDDAKHALDLELARLKSAAAEK